MKPKNHDGIEVFSISPKIEHNKSPFNTIWREVLGCLIGCLHLELWSSLLYHSPGPVLWVSSGSWDPVAELWWSHLVEGLPVSFRHCGPVLTAPSITPPLYIHPNPVHVQNQCPLWRTSCGMEWCATYCKGTEVGLCVLLSYRTFWRWRYIDDVFCIWTETVRGLNHYIPD